jgi:hypothetical protein
VVRRVREEPQEEIFPPAVAVHMVAVEDMRRGLLLPQEALGAKEVFE